MELKKQKASHSDVGAQWTENRPDHHAHMETEHVYRESLW